MKKINASSDQVISNIQQRESLKEQLEKLQLKRGSVSTMKLQPTERKIIIAKQHIDAYRNSTEPKRFEHLLKDAEQDLAHLEEKRIQYEKEIHSIDDELCEVVHKLDNINTAASVETVQQYMKQIDDAAGRVSKIQSLIEEQQKIVQQMDDGSESRLEELQRQQATLLADVKLGDADKADSIALDQEIKALIEESSRAHMIDVPIQRHAQLVISGLTPKLEAAQNNLAELKAGLPMIMESFMISEGEHAGKRYIKHAKALIDEFKTLVAIEEIRASLNLNHEEDFGHLSSMNALRIPSMNLNCFAETVQHNPEQHILYTFTPMTPEKQAEINQAKSQFMKNIQALGLADVLASIGA